MSKSRQIGHVAAFFTVFIWGTTFISTKVLLRDFQPVEILFFRFSMGFLALCLADLHRMEGTTRRQECFFAAAGLCGLTLYYLLENVALTFTLASNAGVIISTAPFFTAVLAMAAKKEEERPGWNFFLGFLVSIAGICLIGFNGARLRLNPAGDLLVVGAAFVWACYSLLMKEIGAFGYPVIQVTRKIFFYGLLWMLPALFLFQFRLDLQRFREPVNLFNMLYLGLGASAACFVTWNFAVKVLGAVKSVVYIYLNPVVTVFASALILREPVTVLSAAGTLLTLAGLILSEWKPKRKEV